MRETEQLDFLDIIALIAFIMQIQTLESTTKLFDYIENHEKKISKILSNQEEILNGLEQKRSS